jgi:PKD repeat protein
VAGTPIAFDAASSRDLDGTVTSYSWSFGDAGTATGRSTSHVYGAPGAYTVTLTVTDDEGATGVASRGVDVGTPPYTGPGATPAGPTRLNSAVTPASRASHGKKKHRKKHRRHRPRKRHKRHAHR